MNGEPSEPTSDLHPDGSKLLPDSALSDEDLDAHAAHGARATASAAARTGWLVAVAVVTVSAVVIFALLFGLVLPQSAEIDQLATDLAAATQLAAEAQARLAAAEEEKDRITAARDSLNDQVEAREGETEALKQRRDELEATLTREQEEHREAQQNKKRKKRRRSR